MEAVLEAQEQVQGVSCIYRYVDMDIDNRFHAEEVWAVEEAMLEAQEQVICQ